MLPEQNSSPVLLPPHTQNEDIHAQVTAWLTSQGWQKSMLRFSRATRVCVATYDVDLTLLAEPITHQPLPSMLCAAGAWAPCGPALSWERRLGRHCLQQKQPVWEQYHNLMWTAALPIHIDQACVGVVVFGWVLDQFADGQSCERVAQSFGLSTRRFYQTAREQIPVGRSRLQAISEMLEQTIENFMGRQVAEFQCRRALLIKEEFLTVVSHELRTPLASLLLRVQNMQRSGRLEHTRDIKSLAVLERSVITQEKLIADLLDASAIVTGNFVVKLGPVNLRKVLRSTLDGAKTALTAKRLDVACEVGELTADVPGDAARLKQVFWNLLFNSIKFTQVGGAITLRLFETVDTALLEVKDTGCGIDPSFLPHLFERFSQIRPHFQSANRGLGLGLAITQHIIELHGGNISAHSRGLGYGSTFIVTLPKRRRGKPFYSH